MTNEQAIQLLHRLQDEQFDGIHGDERREALSMAVRALEGDGDTISRKMAIDALTELRENTVASESFRLGIYHSIEEIKNVPSAQTTQSNADSTQTNALDCVSRQDAIDALDGFRCGTKAAWKVIEDLPSAQPERKTGRWKPLYDNIWICTNCEQTEQFGVNIESASDYCPNCGARME